MTDKTPVNKNSMPLIDDIVKTMAESRAKDDEGEFDCLFDLINFSGENKTRTVIRSSLMVALNKIVEYLENECDNLPMVKTDYDAGCQQGVQMAASWIEALTR